MKTRILVGAISLWVLAGCFAPSQNFPIGSALWKEANPELENFETISQNRHAVLVGVLDGGVDYNAPSLRRHLHVFSTPESSGRTYGVGYDVLGNDFFPNYRIINPETSLDVSSDLMVKDHGTHVSQLVTLNDRTIGIIPVRVLPLSIPPEDAQTPSNPADRFISMNDPVLLAKMAKNAVESIARGIEFSVSHGARIVNMSLGLAIDELKETDRQDVMTKIDREITSRLTTDWKDCLMVIAAGNENTRLERAAQSIPATIDSPDLLVVGALKNKSTIAFYSNDGRYVDIWVQGSEINSAVPGGRARHSGTSMATPIVAHAAAQLKVIDPTLTPRQLRALLLNTAIVTILPVEPPENGGEAPAPRQVRILDMLKARRQAKRLLTHPEERERWLTPPFDHAHAPH